MRTFPESRPYSNDSCSFHQPAHPSDNIGDARRYASDERYDAIVDPGIISDFETGLWLGFRANRPYHNDLSDRRLAVATGDRDDHRQAPSALFASGGHDVHAFGSGLSGLCA